MFGVSVHFHLTQPAAEARHLNPMVQEWTRQNLRTYLYPPEWDHFMYKLEHEKSEDGDILLVAPSRPFVEPTLHSDAGPAFIGLAKCTLFCGNNFTHSFHIFAGTLLGHGPRVPNTWKLISLVAAPLLRMQPSSCCTAESFPSTWHLTFGINCLARCSGVQPSASQRRTGSAEALEQKKA